MTLTASGTDSVDVQMLNNYYGRGYLNEFIQEFNFELLLSGGVGPAANTPVMALFEAYLIRTPLNPEPGRDSAATLTGSFHLTRNNTVQAGFPVTSSRRHRFGWFAQITEVV